MSILPRPGRARAWQIAAALSAVRQAFPTDKVYVARSTLGSDVLHIVVNRLIEDLRELATWRPRGLRIAFPVLAACADEAAVARLVEGAVPEIVRGAVVEIGIRQAEAEAKTQPAPDRFSGRRGPRLGRRVPEEELRTLLRKAVVR